MRRRDFVKMGAVLGAVSTLMRPRMWADVPDRSVPAIMLQLLYEIRRKVRRIGQLEHGPFRIGVGDDRLRVNLFARRKQHARRCAVLDPNLNNLSAGANLRARSLEIRRASCR